eukprot:3674495-Pleurochrysis_carterae.AAC.7
MISNSHFLPNPGWSLQVGPVINTSKRYTPNESVRGSGWVALSTRSDRAVTNGGTAVDYSGVRGPERYGLDNRNPYRTALDLGAAVYLILPTGKLGAAAGVSAPGCLSAQLTTTVNGRDRAQTACVITQMKNTTNFLRYFNMAIDFHLSFSSFSIHPIVFAFGRARSESVIRQRPMP